MRSKTGIVLNQRKYALELISDLGLTGSKPMNTPMEQNTKLTSKNFDIQAGFLDENGELMTEPAKYRTLIGKLLYLTTTRPDISFSVQALSQFMSSHKQSHYEAAIRVVKYIKKEPGKGLFMKEDTSEVLSAYCDSDWGACLESRKSITGYAVKMGDNLICWKVKKQTVIARSSAEAEYRSMANTVAELMWLKGIASELKVRIDEPIKIFSDSKSAIQIAKNPVYHDRTKHIEIDCHFIREAIQKKLVETIYVPTTEQLADMLTKALGRQQFEYLLCKLGMINLYHPQLEGECQRGKVLAGC